MARLFDSGYTHAMFMQNRLVQVVVCCLVAGYLFAGFIGVSHIGMGQEMNGQRMGCPFMPGVVICNMTPMQHVAAAQSMFNALPIQVDFSTLLLALLAAVIGFLPLLRQSLFPPIPASVRPGVIRGYIPTHIALQEIFARGILNPKLF